MSTNSNHIPDSILNAESTIQAESPILDTVKVAESVPKTVEKQPQVDKKEDSLTSTRFAQLSKKEAALVKEREAFKKERETFLSQQSEVDKYRKAWEMVNEIADLQKTDAVAAMRKAGFKDADLLNFLAQNEDTSTPEEKAVKLAQAEIEKFRAEQLKVQEDAKSNSEKLQKAEEEKVLANFKVSIEGHIKSSADKHEFLNFYGEPATELVYETISSILNDSGEMISIDEACQLVEDFYEEQDKAMNSLKKRSANQIKAAPVPKEETKKEESIIKTTQSKPKIDRIESRQYVDNKIQVKTLTNKLNATSSSISSEELSPAENRQRVIEKYMAMNKK